MRILVEQLGIADVMSGYHMNKTHWNTITIGGDVPVDELKRMVGNSYDLIKPKVRERKYVYFA